MVEGEVRGWFPLAGIVLDEQGPNRLVSEAEAALGSLSAAFRDLIGSVDNRCQRVAVAEGFLGALVHCAETLPDTPSEM